MNWRCPESILMNCDQLIEEIKHLLSHSNVDQGHQVDHAITVMNTAINALERWQYDISDEQKEAIIYASLLHDVDDRKFFSSSDTSNNALNILNTVMCNQSTINLVIEMIDLVSFSKNGNTVNIPFTEIWKLIPRVCDRLESIGAIGAKRCWDYSMYIGRPLFIHSSPKPTTEEEIWGCATQQRLERYMRVKVSDSMIDHYYDKLLHINNPVPNDYLDDLLESRLSYSIKFLLRWGNKNILGPYSKIVCDVEDERNGVDVASSSFLSTSS